MCIKGLTKKNMFLCKTGFAWSPREFLGESNVITLFLACTYIYIYIYIYKCIYIYMCASSTKRAPPPQEIGNDNQVK